MSFKKILLLFNFALFLPALEAVPSMQKFFNQNSEQLWNVFWGEEPIEVVMPALEAFVQDGGNVNQRFYIDDEQDGDEDSHTVTLLLGGVYLGSVEFIKWLLQHGANPLVRSAEGKTAFFGIFDSMVLNSNVDYHHCCNLMRINRLMLDVIAPADRAVILNLWKDKIFLKLVVMNNGQGEQMFGDTHDLWSEFGFTLVGGPTDHCVLKDIAIIFSLFYHKHPDDFAKMIEYFEVVLSKDEKIVLNQMVDKAKAVVIVDFSVMNVD